MKKEEIEKLIRPNIKKLIPYEAARHLMNEPAILLDANENPFETEVNRYPDPFQRKLKNRISELKNVLPGKIFIGNGSDEIIDLLMRIFCEPGKDKIITTPPTYGMYEVSAAINNVAVTEVVLNDDFSLDPEQVLSSVKPETKLIFLCTPNNPTGNRLSDETIKQILDNFKGIVVLDEAYVDFSSAESWIKKLDSYENLVVMQTLSKAYGLAGVRLGLAFCSEYLISLLNKVKPPYNISAPNQHVALQALEDINKVRNEVAQIIKERQRLENVLSDFESVVNIFPSDANFLLVRMSNADKIFDYLKSEGIVVRSRSKVIKCEGCLRITVGTVEENDLLIKKLKKYEETTSSVH